MSFIACRFPQWNLGVCKTTPVSSDCFVTSVKFNVPSWNWVVSSVCAIVCLLVWLLALVNSL